MPDHGTPMPGFGTPCTGVWAQVWRCSIMHQVSSALFSVLVVYEIRCNMIPSLLFVCFVVTDNTYPLDI